MSSPDEKEPGEPRLPANDNLEGLAVTLDEIAAQPFGIDSGNLTEEHDVAEDLSGLPDIR